LLPCLLPPFHATAPSHIYPLSLHDALPISVPAAHHTGAIHDHRGDRKRLRERDDGGRDTVSVGIAGFSAHECTPFTAEPERKERSEEHTSELQSRENLVCRLLLEKKKKIQD